MLHFTSGWNGYREPEDLVTTVLLQYTRIQRGREALRCNTSCLPYLNSFLLASDNIELKKANCAHIRD